MSFADSLNKICKRAGDKAEMVVRKTALELQSQMIERSPVDTGRFKGNWQCGIGSMNADTNAAPDKSGQGALGRTAAVLQGWKPGQTIVLSNSLPYAKRLELGWSKQAPAGVVRLTVQNYSAALANAVAGLKD